MTYPALRSGARTIVTFEEFPGPQYPYYASGPRYMMTMDVAQTFSAMTHNVPFLPIEDVYMGIIGHLAGIEVEYSHFDEGATDDCGHGFVWVHKESLNLTLEHWKSCNRTS